MLRPQDTATRERKRLDGLWRFRLDPESAGRTHSWYAGPLDEARLMPVPASFNDLVTDLATRNYAGDIWYQTDVRIPRGWTGQRILIHLESATHRGTVWVNDVELGSHQGGYLPFEFEITGHVTPGEVVRITVCVNNVLTFQTIPPGVTEDRVLRYFHDFFNYAGIHRSVWLHATPQAHLDDLTIVTGFEGTTGSVQVSVAAVDADELEIRTLLRDAEGVDVATGSGAEHELTVPEVKLWKPGAAYLYDLEVQLVRGDVVVDSHHTRVGVRTVEVRGTEFLVNGTPVYFRGFGMHEDHVTIGKQHCNASMVRDFELLDWIGANSFRTSHYQCRLVRPLLAFGV